MRDHDEYDADDFDGHPYVVIERATRPAWCHSSLGIALGAGAALLLAPRSGAETRRMIGDRARTAGRRRPAQGGRRRRHRDQYAWRTCESARPGLTWLRSVESAASRNPMRQRRDGLIRRLGRWGASSPRMKLDRRARKGNGRRSVRRAGKRDRAGAVTLAPPDDTVLAISCLSPSASCRRASCA